MRKDQRPPPGGRPGWFAPRDWSLRTKLAVILLVPAVLAVVLGGLRINDQAAEAAELDRVSRFVDAQAEVAALVERMQWERYLATAYVAAGRSGDVAPFQRSGADTDAAGAAARPAVEGLYGDDQTLVDEQRQADQALARLPGLRTEVTTAGSPPAAVITRYNDLIAQLLQLDGALLRGVNTMEANGLADALGGLAAARNEVSLQQALLDVATRGPLTGVDLVELQSSQARSGQSLAQFRAALDTGQRIRHAELIAGPANAARTAAVDGVLAGGPSPAAADVQGLFEAVLAELDQAEDGVRTELTGATAAARQTALTLAAVNAVVLLLVLLLGAVVVGLVARQLIRSLRVLRRGALEVADTRLPEAVARMRQGGEPDTEIVPVPVTTREEVGEVARAFDAVHAQAVRLAAEQAALQADVNAMFVNLSRRSQTLVDRQLKLIEELEAGEEDPDQLSALFRLDHLATRMRRNSENLLVLAGTELTQRATRPVPAIEVLQAAVSEVEQYRRIVVQSPPDVAVIGRVGNDLQHLLAELLENAANFSPPDSRVAMSTSRTADGALLVEIADGGVGVPPDELAALNDQLRTAADATVEASRRMGLFVVGRLAARHGIDVGLLPGSSGTGPGGAVASGSPGTGLTARVRVPRHLLADQAGGTPGGLPQRSVRDEAAAAFGWGPGHGNDPDRAPGQPIATALPVPSRTEERTEREPGELPVRSRTAEPAGHGSAVGEPAGGELPRRDRTGRPEPEPERPAAEEPVWPLPAVPARAGERPVREEPVGEEPAWERRAPTEPDREEPVWERAASPEPEPQRAVSASGRPVGAEREVSVWSRSVVREAGPTEVPVRSTGAAADPVAEPSALDLFTASTPAVPLPDPFAAERPRDPFAAPVESGTPVFAEVRSGWFRAHAPTAQPPTAQPPAGQVPVVQAAAAPAPVAQPAAGQRAEAPEPVAADVGAGRGPSPWERAGRERVVRQPVGAGGEGGAGVGGVSDRPAQRSWEPPRQPPPVPRPRSWTDQEDPDAPAPTPPPSPPAPRPEPGSGDESLTQLHHPHHPQPQPPGAEDFATGADTGWRAAEAMSQDAPDVTAAGLPRRTPLARLVPGSASTSEPVSRPARRDAEAVRGRLTSYQRGVRSGRETRDRTGDANQPGGPPAE